MPPATASLKVNDGPPTQAEDDPLMALMGLTVIVELVRQLPDNAYVTATVPLEDPPVTIPVEPTVAIAGLAEVHVPPAVASLRVITAPWQTLPTPEIADGAEVTETVTFLTLEHTPFVEVTV